MQPALYLDANATSHVLPAARDAALRAMALQFGNPSSTHAHGLVAKELMEQARAVAAKVLGAGGHHVVFTSGATEGIQTAVLSALCDIRARRDAGQTTGKLLVYGPQNTRLCRRPWRTGTLFWALGWSCVPCRWTATASMIWRC